MTKKEITAPEMVTQASVGGRKLTLDPTRVHPITIEIREVESTIPCGFQAEFGTVDVDGDELSVCAGAGFGSQWITMQFKGKSYCFPITEVISAFLEQLEADSGNS
jgi:hypothetical protein